MSNSKLVIACTMIVSCSPVVHGQISGKLDTLLETDQTAYYSRSRIEEQVDINWRNDENDMSAGFQFDFGHEEIESQSPVSGRPGYQVNQLFFAHQATDINYTLGRFNRSDMLGFYTVDGFSMKYAQTDWDVGIHAGKPLQIEDYIIIDADKIYGIDVNHHAKHINSSIIQNFDSYIGWQQIEKDIKQTYIHWGISGDGELAENKRNQVEVFFNGSYLAEINSASSINAGIQLHSSDLGLARITYRIWKPEQAKLSFKEQFYSVYANGSQTILQADIFHNHKWNQQIYIRGRKVWREFGDDGYGATAGFEKKATNKATWGWQTQWDSLVLKDDFIHSLYLGMNKNISATLRGHLNTALQYKESGSTENNSLIALEAVAEQMLNSSLFFDLNARYIYNENQSDEYRIGFRLSYRFDDRIRSRQ